MLKTGLTLIGLALAVVGFAAGMYYGQGSTDPVSVWLTPRYEPRAHYEGPDGSATPAKSDGGLGEDAARRAVLEALAEPDAFLRVERLAKQLGSLGSGDAAVIETVLEDRDLDLGATEYELLTRFWARHDSEAALHWAAFASPSSYRLPALLPAMEIQAGRDPNVALQVFDEMNRVPNPNSAAAQVALVRGWYDSGKPGLEDYIRHLGIGYERQRLMGVFARRAIMRDGPNEIMAWAQSLPDEDEKFKITVYRQIGSELGQLNPAAAAAWCDAVCDGPFGSSVRTLIAQRWAVRDGLAAMRWVQSAEPGQERDWAVAGAYRGWWRERPEEFDAWLNEETQNGTRIEPWLVKAIGVYPAHFAQKNPDRIDYALKWASRIPDEEQRNRAYVSVSRIWYKNDPEAATAWIEQSPLDETGRKAARTLGTQNPYSEAGKKAAARAEGSEAPDDAETGGADETRPETTSADAP